MNQFRQTLNDRSGLTIVELIVVCSIITIVAAIAVPITVRQIRLHTLDSSVSVISNKVKEARMEAIKRNRPVTWVRLDAGVNTAQVRSTDNDGNSIDVGYPLAFSDGVVLDPASSVEISFDSFGRRTPATQLTVALLETGSGSHKNIVVSPAGKVSVGPVY